MKLRKILESAFIFIVCVAMLSTNVFAADMEISTAVGEVNEPVVESGAAPDVPSDHWANKTIAALIEKGIVSGDDFGNVRPNDLINREEAAKLVVEALDIALEGSVDNFADAADISEWAKAYMAAAVNAGIFNGNPDGTISAKGAVTREQFAAIVIRAYGFGEGIGELMFADAAELGWSKGYVAKAVELGIVTGYDDNTFKAGNTITRAEAFTMLTRAMKLKEALDAVAPVAE